jgi:hypothetical protein
MIEKNTMASINEELARQINQEARQDPTSPYAGKKVGIANGRVVIVADTWREMAERLRQVEPDPAKCYCIEASADYRRVEDVWTLDWCPPQSLPPTPLQFKPLPADDWFFETMRQAIAENRQREDAANR